MFSQEILIALGANLPSAVGSPQKSLLAAAQRLGENGFVIRNMSRVYATPCFPAGAGPDYANAALSAQVAPGMTPADVLATLHTIEAEFGRARDQRWGSRSLDLDLVAFGQAVLPDRPTYMHWQNLPAEAQIQSTPDQLILPHPRLADRAFVLVPLSDVAPGWCHPVTGKTVLEMRDALPRTEIEAVKPFSG